METINDRIEQVINHSFEGNKVAFANHIGVPPTSMSNYFGKQRRSKVSVDMLEKIVRTMDVDARWLLTGEESVQKEIKTQGDYSPASDSGDISVVVGDAVLGERLRLQEKLLAEKDSRIAELIERITELKERIEELKEAR